MESREVKLEQNKCVYSQYNTIYLTASDVLFLMHSEE